TIGGLPRPLRAGSSACRNSMTVAALIGRPATFGSANTNGARPAWTRMKLMYARSSMMCSALMPVELGTSGSSENTTGQLPAGGTYTVNLRVAVELDVIVTVVVPIGKNDPDAGVPMSGPQLPVDTGGP